MRTKSKIAIGLASAALAVTQAAQAGYITEYTYNGKTIDVFSLSTWNSQPVGAVVVSNNVAWTSGWTVPAGVNSVQVLLVGGGGGADGGPSGYNWNGGGGGGFLELASYSVTPGNSLTVTVGAGGAGSDGTTAGTGGLSQFDALIAYGGTGGKAGSRSTGGNSGTNNYNSVGGILSLQNMGSGDHGAGGAGVGGANFGTYGTVAYNFNGGPGLPSTISGSTLLFGGGGGGDNGAEIQGLGSDGGGNAALTDNASGTVGTANTGGGGGASRGSGHPGMSGGSGIVIVSYAIPEPGSLTLLGLLGGALLLRRKLRRG